jgi:eukaryotic-like serine/threonine-protein kinase
MPITNEKRRAPRDSRLGDYHVVAPLARGGTAGVYLAEHGLTHERVALKVLDPYHANNQDLVTRLLDERTISARAQHRNLLRIDGAAQSPYGVPYLVMEFLDGETLGTLAERGRMELDAITAIAAQVAHALAALHEAGVAHGDVKAENVMVLYPATPDAAPEVKVIDFGVARRLDDDRPGPIAGTPAYMSPEHWRGLATPKSDVYSLGCMLYELITGEPPFHGTLPQLMNAHDHRLPERLSHHRASVDARLDDLVMRALAKDPAKRPAMDDFACELQRLARDTAS